MENLGEILRRIGTKDLVRNTNGGGALLPPEPERADDCPRCNGSGWVTQRVHVGHPNFGQATPCQCRETEKSLPSRLDALRRYSNLGALSQLTFDVTRREGPMNDIAGRRMFGEALPLATAYAENPDGWLVLTGPSGSGKTHLAAAIANRCIERQQTVFFIMVADLLDHLRAAYSPASEVAYDELFEQVRNVPVLVLDDLGAHSSTPWAQEKLFQVINYRHSNSLPTAVTVRGPLIRLDEWIRTRLQAEGRSIVMQLGRFNSLLPKGLGEVPPYMQERMTFTSFDPDGGPKANSEAKESLQQALRTAQVFASFPEGWLLFTGARGSGKTHLAVAIAGESLRQGIPVFYAFVPALLGHLRSTYRPDSQVGFDDIFEEVLNAPLLILDDLGAERNTAWAEEKLYHIVVHRFEARLPTVISSASLMSEIEESRPALTSRLVDRKVVDWVPIVAPNFKDERR